MMAYYAKAAKLYLIIALIPMLVGLTNVYHPGLGFMLILFGLPLSAIFLLLVTGLAIGRGIGLARQASSRLEAVGYVMVSPMMCCLVLLSAWPSLFVGGYMGDLSRLAFNHAHYQRIISKALTTRTADWYADDDGVTYSVDLGPPVRVAFNPAGMLDNWSAIIFDPSGEMLKADGFDPKTGKFRAPDRITNLFGGDLVSCSRLWGNYLSCSFT